MKIKVSKKRTDKELENHLEKTKLCKRKFLFVQDLSIKNSRGLFSQKKYKFFCVSCKSYFCPHCVAHKKQEIKHRIKPALAGDTWRFITLTTSKKNFTTDEALKHISIDFNNFMTSIRKKFPGIKYFKVLEISKSESIHLHLLINLYIPKAIIKRLWIMAHASFIVDIRKVSDNTHALNYILKYFTKETENFQVNKYFYSYRKRHFSLSQNFCQKSKSEKKYKLILNKPYKSDGLITHIARMLSLSMLDTLEIDWGNAPPDVMNILLDTFP